MLFNLDLIKVRSLLVAPYDTSNEGERYREVNPDDFCPQICGPLRCATCHTRTCPKKNCCKNGGPSYVLHLNSSEQQYTRSGGPNLVPIFGGALILPYVNEEKIKFIF